MAGSGRREWGAVYRPGIRASYTCNDPGARCSLAAIAATPNWRIDRPGGPTGASSAGPPQENGDDLLMTAAKDILIIEDDEILRDLVADWMAVAGYGVRVAADGDAGLAAIDDHPPALVVTDIHMPGAGGAAVIAELRRTHPAVPVIAISAYFKCGHGLTADGAIALGAARALAKPFSRREMVGAVAALVGPPGA